MEDRRIAGGVSGSAGYAHKAAMDYWYLVRISSLESGENLVRIWIRIAGADPGGGLWGARPPTGRSFTI